MKYSIRLPKPAKLHSFTLVELLVVMGIIGILAAVLLSAGNMALKAALRAKAAATASQIQTSVLNYYTEYSVYPQDTTTFPSGADYKISDTSTTDAANWKNLLIALCGNINPYTAASVSSPVITTNTRNISYLSLRTSDIYSSTLVAPKNPLSPSTTANIYFNIAIDGDYDGVLGAGSSAITMPSFSGSTYAATGGTSTAGAAVWANCNSGTTSTNANYFVHTY